MEETMTVEIDIEEEMTTGCRATVLIRIGVHHLIEVVETCHITTTTEVDHQEIIVIKDATTIETAIMNRGKEEKDLDLITITGEVEELGADQDHMMDVETEAAEDTTAVIEVLLQEVNTMATKAQTLT